MTTYFVNRHAGAIDWAARHNIAAERVIHFDVTCVKAGDTVLGTLPVQLIAEVNARGARYFHLEMDVPAPRRGSEITADDMQDFGAKLTEFKAVRVVA
jgi:CRISPR-associated protein Csx16